MCLKKGFVHRKMVLCLVKGIIKEKRGFLLIRGGNLCRVRGPKQWKMVKKGKMRALTKFLANLVIPKAYLWLYFNQREGIYI